jgi:cytoplasmic iron level regulating protein YaaA (DUF328/UPF0246 family)
MNFFLLPWSSLRSGINTIERSFWEVGNRFSQLDPLRRTLMEEFGVKAGPLSPVWRRYRGKFWEELCLWALPAKVREEVEKKGLVLSPLFGVLSVGDAIPLYRVRWDQRFGGTTLLTFWRRHLEGLLLDLFSGTTVLDLSGSAERSLIRFPKNCIRVTFEYYRNGRKVRNSQPHRAFTLRYIVEMGVGLEDLHRINFLDYKVKEVVREGRSLRVVMQGEGRYL